MDTLNLNQAARAVGISRNALNDMVESGVISANWDRIGNRIVSVSELLRVFGELKGNAFKREARSSEQAGRG